MSDAGEDIFAGIDDFIDNYPSDIGKELATIRTKAIDDFLSVYITIERISERVGFRELSKWLLTNTRVGLDEWYAQAIVLPPEDRKRIRGRLKKSVNWEKYRDDRAKRVMAAMDISEVDDHIAQDIKLLEASYEDDEDEPPADGVWGPDQDQDRIIGLPEPTEECKKLLAQAILLEKNHRVKLGEIYHQLREIVQSGRAGIDPETEKPWAWMRWSELYIARSARTIQDNISVYLDSVNDVKPT